MHLSPRLLLIAACLATASVHAEAVCQAKSGAHARPLLELYTSEGCDSCPPAERWLSSRFGAGDAHPAAIALAFHVDYWDRLGWVDRFGSHDYTARQYDRMRANGASFVYTPQFLLQGRDFAQWQGSDAAAVDRVAGKNAGATIALDVTPGVSRVDVHAAAHVLDANAARDAKLVVAYADSGLVSEVEAGENRGKRLAHDHVVRALRVVQPARDGRFDATIDFALPAERGTHAEVVAFVERASAGDVLQALALPLDGCPMP